MLIATYDYWGYYNITFLGGEVKDPARTIPRAILISIGLVAAIYLLMNVMVLAVLPWQTMLAQQDLGARRAIISLFMEAAYGPRVGPLLGDVCSSADYVHSVRRDLFAAAGLLQDSLRCGPRRQLLYAVRPTSPHTRLSICLIAYARWGCHLLLLLSAQGCHCRARGAEDFIAVPDAACRRPLPAPDPASACPAFPAMALSVPPLLAIAGFTYILVSRPNFQRELMLAVVLIVSGSAVFLLRAAPTGQNDS